MTFLALIISLFSSLTPIAEFSELSIKSSVNSIDVYETEFDGGKTVYSKLKSFEFSRS